MDDTDGLSSGPSFEPFHIVELCVWDETVLDREGCVFLSLLGIKP